MAFIDDARKGGRVALNIVELGLDNKLHPSGTENHCDGNVPWGQRFFASISAIDFTPTKIVSFDGLSFVGQITVDFQDFEYGGGDYFARLIAMNPYYFNRELKIKTGYTQDGFNINNFRTRLYFIKKIDYDWQTRRCRITAKDPLSKVDEKGLTVPAETRGKLLGPIPANIVSLSAPYNSYIPAEIYSAGFQDAYAIDSEIIWVINSGATIYRGMVGTKSADHSQDALMRKVLIYFDRNPIDALIEILTNYAGLGAYIDLNDWYYVRDTYTIGDQMNGVVVNPLTIKAITKKICEQFGINIWFDDEAQKLKVQAIGYTLADIKKIDWISNILNQGHTFSKDIQKAVTQIWFYYGKTDPTKGDSSENYSSLYIYFDGNLEGETGHRTAIIKKVYADFVGSGSLGVALKIASRIMARQREGYQEITFRLDAKDSDINAGDIVEITTKIIQDSNGAPLPKNFEIIEKEQISETVWQYRGTFGGATKKAKLIAPNNMADYSVASSENKLKYMFISNNNGLMNDTTEGGLIV